MSIDAYYYVIVTQQLRLFNLMGGIVVFTMFNSLLLGNTNND
jgi:hypothetical protein